MIWIWVPILLAIYVIGVMPCYCNTCKRARKRDDL